MSLTQPPSLLPGKSARHWWRHLNLAFFVVAACSLAVIGMLAATASIAAWRQVHLLIAVILLGPSASYLIWAAAQTIRAGIRESRAGYTTVSGGSRRLWLLDSQTGRPLRAPTQEPWSWPG